MKERGPISVSPVWMYEVVRTLRRYRLQCNCEASGPEWRCVACKSALRIIGQVEDHERMSDG